MILNNINNLILQTEGVGHLFGAGALALGAKNLLNSDAVKNIQQDMKSGALSQGTLGRIGNANLSERMAKGMKASGV